MCVCCSNYHNNMIMIHVRLRAPIPFLPKSGYKHFNSKPIASMCTLRQL